MMLSVILLAVFFIYCEGGEPIYINTTGDGSFTNVMEKGIVVSGTYSLLFSVQACAESVIVLSNIVSVTNTRGKYFLVMLGTDSNTKVSVTDSCFRCDRKNESETKLLHCGRFVDVWCRWDGEGHIEVGKGKKLGDKTVVAMQHGEKVDYPVYSVAVTSTNGIKASWKFNREPLDTLLLQPGPHGWSLVEISDLTPPGSDVIDILLTPRDRSANFNLAGESVDLFSLANNTIKLAKSLNYSQPFHVLQIRSDTGFNTSLTVVVTQGRPRLNNDNLDVHVNDVITIPEELPPGSVIDWNLTVSDTDRNDISTFTINGSMTGFFTVLEDGELQIQKLIDRDAKPDNIHGGELMLTVSDFKPNIRKANISVRIKDINDNPPVFEKDIYVVSVQENSHSDVELLTLKCTDDDEGLNGQVTMSIFEDRSKSNSFYLKGSRLYIKAGSLDYEGSESHMETVIVHAVDTPETGDALTGSVAILVKVLPKDEFDPVWVSPIPDQRGQFPDLEVLAASAAGTLVGIFKISDKDDGDGMISYTLQSASSSDRNGNLFILNSETGELKTRVSLDQRGQQAEYDIAVAASSGEKVMQANMKVKIVSHMQPIIVTTIEPLKIETHAPKTEVKIPSQPGNLPAFDKIVYVIEKSTVRDWRRPLLNIHVTIPGSSIRPSVILDNNGEKYFRLRKSHNSWKLFADTRVHSENIPSVIVLKAFQPSDNTVSSTAHVLISDHVTECSISTSLPALHDTAEGATAPPVHLHVTTQDNYKSKCGPPDDTSERVLILITIAEAAGLLSVVVFRKRLTKVTKSRRRKQKTVRRPIRQEPIGCEKGAERRESIRRMSFQNKESHIGEKLNKPCVMTLAEVENDDDETDERQATSHHGTGPCNRKDDTDAVSLCSWIADENTTDKQHFDDESSKHRQQLGTDGRKRLAQSSDVTKASLEIRDVEECVNMPLVNIAEDDQKTDDLIKELEQELEHADEDENRIEGKNASLLEDIMSICEESETDDHDKSRLNPDGCLSEESIRSCCLKEDSDTDETKSALEKNGPSDETNICLTDSDSAHRGRRSVLVLNNESGVSFTKHY